MFVASGFGSVRSEQQRFDRSELTQGAGDGPEA